MTHRQGWLASWRIWSVGFLFVAMALLWLGWPLVALDFDLWYHLAGGAYIIAHHALPTGPFFSYITVPSGWVDYYWLFQVLVHGLYRAGGYPALVLLRAGLYLATVALVYRYCREGTGREAKAGFLPCLVLACAFALALMPRELILRPHAFTYLFLVVLHYVVNRRQRLAWLLPVAAVAWANLHGVEYPVVMLACGAYLAEYFADTLLGRPQASRLRAVRWPLIASLYAVLATPAGLALLPKPFASPPFHEIGVIELAPQPLDKFLALFFYPDGRLVEGATNALVLAAVAGAVWLGARRRLRLSRLVLLAGGLVLLPMMRRFTFEFMLLTLPILGDAAGLVLDKVRRHGLAWPAGATWAATAAVILLTLVTTSTYLGNRPHYPVDLSRLPEGVCQFLLRQGPGGRVYNVPNPGGYLQWRLHPKYTIGMDMETMLFSTRDLYASVNAFGDAAVLGKVLDQYQPTFLLAEVGDAQARKTIGAFPRFVPVFFDDVLMLYADGQAHPDLVGRYRLEALDPVAWQKDDYEAMSPERREAVMAECRRLLEVYPGGMTAHTIAAKVRLASGDTAYAKIHADVIIRRFPDRYMGYALKGLVAFKEEHYEEALDLYRLALDRALPVEAPMVRRNIYAAYVRLRRFDKAYAALLAVCNPLGRGTPAKDLYDLSLAAVASGHGREGRALLELARCKVPAEDTRLAADIEEFRRTLPAAP
jgi:tetratricopeptide (TPR) repeat protein